MGMKAGVAGGIVPPPPASGKDKDKKDRRSSKSRSSSILASDPSLHQPKRASILHSSVIEEDHPDEFHGDLHEDEGIAEETEEQVQEESYGRQAPRRSSGGHG